MPFAANMFGFFYFSQISKVLEYYNVKANIRVLNRWIYLFNNFLLCKYLCYIQSKIFKYFCKFYFLYILQNWLFW